MLVEFDEEDVVERLVNESGCELSTSSSLTLKPVSISISGSDVVD